MKMKKYHVIMLDALISNLVFIFFFLIQITSNNHNDVH
jgi:hypothetical protein